MILVRAKGMEGYFMFHRICKSLEYDHKYKPFFVTGSDSSSRKAGPTSRPFGSV